MKLNTCMQFDSIVSNFYSNTVSEKEIKNEDYDLNEDVFCGDIDEDGRFAIKCYTKSRYGTLILLMTYISGRVIKHESGECSVEFSYVCDNNQRAIPYIVLVMAISAFFSTVFSDPGIAFVILVVGISLFLLSYFDPFTKIRLRRHLKKIII